MAESLRANSRFSHRFLFAEIKFLLLGVCLSAERSEDTCYIPSTRLNTKLKFLIVLNFLYK